MNVQTKVVGIQESLESLMSRLKPRLADLGISRVGDITGLDVLGIPVFHAVRPNARSLSVSQGKGWTPARAWIGAVGEAVESAVAETTMFVRPGPLTWNEATSCGTALVDLTRQARCNVAWLDRDRKRHWVEGRNLGTGEAVLAPYELIGIDMRVDAGWDKSTFCMSSVGLACHTDLDAAICHGLQELIEDDALETTVAFNLAAAKRRTLLPSNRCSTAMLPNLFETLEKHGLKLSFFGIDNIVKVPVVLALLETVDQNEDGHPPYMGSGCSHSVAHAMAAAALEAVQTRLTVIAGAREDLTPDVFGQFGNTTSQSRTAIRFETVEPALQKLPQEHTAVLMAALKASGVENVYTFHLATLDPGLHVVRVLADDVFSSARPPGHVYAGEKARRLMQALRS